MIPHGEMLYEQFNRPLSIYQNSVLTKRHHLEALRNKLIQILIFIPQSLEMIEKLSITFTAKGKCRIKICVLPKMEETRFILAHFLRVRSRYQVTFQKRETSLNNIIFVLL